MEKIITFPLTWIPLVVHLIDDREGDSKKGNDLIVLSIIAGVLAIGANIAGGIEYLKFFAAVLGVHTLLFDYWENLQLYRNGISASGDWFSYLGKTAKLDTWALWIRIGKYGRLAVRLTVFLPSMWYYWIAP
jgi:hypothetical protein